MRKASGLRNRNRDGRGTYSKKGKSRKADSYGSWDRGRQIRPDIIAGMQLELWPIRKKTSTD